MSFQEIQQLIMFAASAIGLMLALYTALPKAFQSLLFLNRWIENIHHWLNKNVFIGDVYNTLENHEQRISKLEGDK